MMAAVRLQGGNAGRPAAAAMFVLNGACYGSWAARIPAVKAQLGLSDSQLGRALLAFAIGAVATMPLTGAVVRRAGGRRACRVAAPAFALSIALPGLAPAFGWLLAALLLAGAANGSLDVAMNANGTQSSDAPGAVSCSRCTAGSASAWGSAGWSAPSPQRRARLRPSTCPRPRSFSRRAPGLPVGGCCQTTPSRSPAGLPAPSAPQRGCCNLRHSPSAQPSSRSLSPSGEVSTSPRR